MKPIIEMKDVTFTYLGETEPALIDINLEIMQGDYVLIMGPSGSGKSSLLNMMNSSVPNIFDGKLDGTVLIDGKNSKEYPLVEFAKTVGMVFQDPDSQLVNVFVNDEIYFGPENLCMPREEILARAEDAIKLTDIGDFLDQEVFYLSGGQKQKLALAAVLSMNPKAILLDQPTANLDPKTKLDVFNLLAKLNREKGLTVVVIEHDVDDIADVVNKVVIMDKGRIAHVGPPREVFSNSDTEFSQSLGLWVPQISELALAMKGEIDFDPFPITPGEALEGFANKINQLGGMVDDLPYVPVFERVNRDETPLIEVKHLDFSYGASEKKALSDINFKMYPGEFLAILGKNGSGKSTLAKALMKINKVPNNSVFINGKDINKISLYDLTKDIGYVFQSPDHQFVADTVYDEVAYSLRVRGMGEESVREKVEPMLEMFGLSEFVDVSPFALSMGKRRLLSVATMLVVEQRLIILDEPTISQDQVSSNLLMGYLKKLNDAGTSIIIISHDMRLISQWVDRAYVMSKSRMLFDGDTREVFNSPELLERAALLPPPLSSLMWQLKDRGVTVPHTVFTVERFMEIYEKEKAKKWTG